jgi:hypothetical protein
MSGGIIRLAKRSAKFFLRSYEVSCEAAPSGSADTVGLVVAPEVFNYGACTVLVGLKQLVEQCSYNT